MSKILITGAAGFIGSQLAYKFIKEGHKLILVDNMSMDMKIILSLMMLT